MNVKNIIFDLGGVVIDLNRLEAVRRLEALGIPNVGEMLDEYEQRWPFLALETGEMTVAQLMDVLRPMCHEGVNDTDIQDAFEAFLVKLPVERLRIIRRVREAGFKVFVLSNTNPIMYNHWIAQHFRADGLSVNDYFDGIVASFEEGTCKPDPNIFLRVTERYGLDPAETLMLDDSAKNCAAAESVGIRAIRIDNRGADSMIAVCERVLGIR